MVHGEGREVFLCGENMKGGHRAGKRAWRHGYHAREVVRIEFSPGQSEADRMERAPPGPELSKAIFPDARVCAPGSGLYAASAAAPRTEESPVTGEG